MCESLRATAMLLLALLAACTRGPDPDGLTGDVQGRFDAPFGQPVIEVATLRRQGSAPYRAADDGSRQVIVYFNAVLRFVEAYDPSDWETLSPALVAGALGAADQGVFGLGAGRHVPGDEFRAFGSLVYRKVEAGWVVADELAPRPLAGRGTGGVTAGNSADDLIQRLAQLVDQSPQVRGAEHEIIAEELDRALRNITLRLERDREGIAIAGGPEGGEYWRFLNSVTQGLPVTARITVVATEGSVANAFLIESDQVRFGLMQSDVAAAAVTGQGVFSDHGPMSHLRAVAGLAPEVVHVVLPANSPVTSIAELAGLRVAVGSPESGSRHTALRLLANAGVDASELAEQYLGDPASALGRLAAGELDAVIEVASPPWTQLQAAAHGTPMRLLAIDAEAAGRIAAEVHGLVPLTIPARTYPGQTEAVPTVAATALLVARSDVADATVEATLELLYAAAAERGGVLAARLSKQRARTGITIPMHDGARNFFERSAQRQP